MWLQIPIDWNSYNKKENFLSKFILSLVFIFLTCLYYFIHLRTGISSDSTTMLPAVRDIINGNVFLKDWVVGTNNFYFSDNIFYLIGFLLGFSSQQTIDWIPAIMFSVLSVLLLIGSLNKISSFKRRIIFGILILCTLIMACASAGYTLLNPNSHNNVYIFIIGLLFCYHKSLTKNSYWAGVIFFIVSILLTFSESFLLMAFTVPFLMLCLKDIIISKKQGAVFYLFFTVVSTILGKLFIFYLNTHGYLLTKGIPVHFSPVNQYLIRFKLFLEQMGILYGYSPVKDFDSTINDFFIGFLVFVAILSFLYSIIKFREIDSVESFCSYVIIINFIFVIVTDVDVFHRYMVPMYLASVVLSVRIFFNVLNQCCWNKKTVIGAIAIGALFLFNTGNIIFHTMEKPVFGNSEKNVVEFIAKNIGGSGYGAFWQSSVVSYYSDFKTPIYPVLIGRDAEFITPYSMLVKKQWYVEKNKHLKLQYEIEHFLNPLTS